MIAIFIANSTAHLSVVSLSSILTNRLVLNLKQAGNSRMQHESSTLPSQAFSMNSFVGNLGAPFRVGNEDDDDDGPQGLGDNDHDLHVLNHEGQAALVPQDA